jgi:hypothetical protein
VDYDFFQRYESYTFEPEFRAILERGKPILCYYGALAKWFDYDLIKTIALLLVPILTLATTLVNAWGVPNADVWAATFAAIDVFCGAVVTVAKQIYERKEKTDEQQ